MKTAMEILINFGLLAAVCIISGYLIKWDKLNKKFALMQGVLFGMTAVLGMFKPLILSDGLIFDGRSIILSLCGLFFGPLAALTASIFALSYRIYQGGAGMTMGILVILTSSLVGCLFYAYRNLRKREISLGMLVVMGMDVHVIMILCIFTLPQAAVMSTFKVMGWIIMTVYPMLTVILGLALKKINAQYIRLIQSEERFRKIFEMAPMGITLSGSQSFGYLQVNPYFADMVGRSPEDLKFLKWSEITHPDDLPENLGLLNAHLEKGVDTLEMDKRYVKPDGDVVWANVKLVDFNEENCQLAFVEDITEKKKTIDELASSEFTFRTLFENSADAIFIIDDDRIIDCNQASVSFFEVPDKSHLIGRSPYGTEGHFQPDGQISEIKGREWVEQCLIDGKAKFDWWHQRKDGQDIPVEIMLSKIMLKGKIVVHALCRDITERKELENHLQYLSYKDQLTGVYNRRFFEEELLRMDVPRNLPFTIIMADVNGLKLINDSFGHQVGDELLIKSAQLIQEGCRSEDVVSRIGGDEFAVILPKTSEEAAHEIISRIESLASKEELRHMEVSIAFGSATKQGDEGIHQILKMAEDQMYKAKIYRSQGIRLKSIKAITQGYFEKNPSEEDHAHRVSVLMERMGNALGMKAMEVDVLKTFGLLHDIGKIAVCDELTAEISFDGDERANRHPEIGARILNSANEFKDLAEVVLAHHENWDGSGYPRGLSKEEIPLYSRMIAIVNTYDRLTTFGTSPSDILNLNQKGIDNHQALLEIEKEAGTKYDPYLVDVFKRMLTEEPCREDQDF